MPNPPYSGGAVLIRENQDGFVVEVFHWDDVPDGSPLPKGVAALRESLFAGTPSFFTQRTPATRTALKNAFGVYVDNKYPDSPA